MTATNQVSSTKIVRSRETGEWIVQAFVNGRRRPQADYFTDDRDDAKATALAMVEGSKPRHTVARFAVVITIATGGDKPYSAITPVGILDGHATEDAVRKTLNFIFGEGNYLVADKRLVR